MSSQRIKSLLFLNSQDAVYKFLLPCHDMLNPLNFNNIKANSNDHYYHPFFVVSCQVAIFCFNSFQWLIGKQL